MSKAERKYAISELEMLALVFGVKSNHAYLSARPFSVITDHKILVSMFQWKKKSGRLSRWMLYLADYDFNIQYQKGSMNKADFLSRIQHTSEPNHDDDYASESIACFNDAPGNEYTTIHIEQADPLSCPDTLGGSHNMPHMCPAITNHSSELSTPGDKSQAPHTDQPLASPPEQNIPLTAMRKLQYGCSEF